MCQNVYKSNIHNDSIHMELTFCPISCKSNNRKANFEGSPRNYTQLSCQKYVFNPLQTPKKKTRDLCLGGTNTAFFVNAIQYFYLVRCGAVHICSHIRFINRFLMSEDGSPLSLPFTSKNGQSHSVAQNEFFFCFVFFVLYLHLTKRHVLAFYRFNFRLKGYSR